MTHNIRILIFAAREDRADGWARAKTLQAALQVGSPSDFDVQWVNRLGRSVADLMLVAKHRIVFSPTVLIVKNDKVVARLLEVPTIEEMSRALEFAKTVETEKPKVKPVKPVKALRKKA